MSNGRARNMKRAPGGDAGKPTFEGAEMRNCVADGETAPFN